MKNRLLDKLEWKTNKNGICSYNSYDSMCDKTYTYKNGKLTVSFAFTRRRTQFCNYFYFGSFRENSRGIYYIVCNYRIDIQYKNKYVN